MILIETKKGAQGKTILHIVILLDLATAYELPDFYTIMGICEYYNMAMQNMGKPWGSLFT